MYNHKDSPNYLIEFKQNLEGKKVSTSLVVLVEYSILLKLILQMLASLLYIHAISEGSEYLLQKHVCDLVLFTS